MESNGGMRASGERCDRERRSVSRRVAKLDLRARGAGGDECIAGDLTCTGRPPIHRIGQFDHSAPRIECDRQLTRLGY